jgi:hypothetical protein
MRFEQFPDFIGDGASGIGMSCRFHSLMIS